MTSSERARIVLAALSSTTTEPRSWQSCPALGFLGDERVAVQNLVGLLGAEGGGRLRTTV